MPKKSSAKKSSKKPVRAAQQKARPTAARKGATVRKAATARRKESPDKYAQSGAPWWKQHLPE